MKGNRIRFWCACLAGMAVMAGSLGLANAARRPYDRTPAFDFTNRYLRRNGITPGLVLMRPNGVDGVSVVDDSPHRDFRDVRIIETTGGFDASGNLLYYTINGMVMPDTFTDNEAGVRAMAIANHYRAFIFPKADGNPLDPAPQNRRQDNIFDTRDGYFSNNPLGLWILTFVSFTADAFETEDGRRALEELGARNGINLDGTPILRTVGEIENLEAQGFVELRTRAPDGADGPPWVL